MSFDRKTVNNNVDEHLSNTPPEAIDVLQQQELKNVYKIKVF